MSMTHQPPPQVIKVSSKSKDKNRDKENHHHHKSKRGSRGGSRTRDSERHRAPQPPVTERPVHISSKQQQQQQQHHRYESLANGSTEGVPRQERYSRRVIASPVVQGHNHPPAVKPKVIISGKKRSRREGSTSKEPKTYYISRSTSKERDRSKENRRYASPDQRALKERRHISFAENEQGSPVRPKKSSRGNGGFYNEQAELKLLKKEIEKLRKEKVNREREFHKTNKEMKEIKQNLKMNQDFLLSLKNDMVQAHSAATQQPALGMATMGSMGAMEFIRKKSYY